MTPDQHAIPDDDSTDEEWILISDAASEEPQHDGPTVRQPSGALEWLEARTPSRALEWLEFPASRDRKLISDHKSESPSSSQEWSPRDNGADVACQNDFGVCTDLHSSLPTSSPTSSDFPTVSSGEFAPYDLLLPDMLPYLTVQDLLNWRLLSHETRSPAALIHHVADMGSMERAESVLGFFDKMAVFRHPTIPNTSAFEGEDLRVSVLVYGPRLQEQDAFCQKRCTPHCWQECPQFASVLPESNGVQRVGHPLRRWAICSYRAAFRTAAYWRSHVGSDPLSNAIRQTQVTTDMDHLQDSCDSCPRAQRAPASDMGVPVGQTAVRPSGLHRGLDAKKGDQKVGVALGSR